MLSLFQVDAELEEEYHHRLERGDGTVTGALGGDMFVQDGKSRLGLTHGDELLCSLERAKSAGEQTEGEHANRPDDVP